MRTVAAMIILVATLSGCQSRVENPAVVPAVSLNDVAAVSAYLAGGGDPDLTSRDGDPLLYIAVGPRGGAEVASLLIEAGADVNGVSADGRPILHNAASWCVAEVASLLLAGGADVTQTDKAGKQVFEAVCKQPVDRRDAMLDLLLGSRN